MIVGVPNKNTILPLLRLGTTRLLRSNPLISTRVLTLALRQLQTVHLFLLLYLLIIRESEIHIGGVLYFLNIRIIKSSSGLFILRILVSRGLANMTTLKTES